MLLHLFFSPFFFSNSLCVDGCVVPCTRGETRSLSSRAPVGDDDAGVAEECREVRVRGCCSADKALFSGTSLLHHFGAFSWE
jgi:hypothetical protein